MEQSSPTSNLQSWHQPTRAVDPSESLRLDDALGLVKPQIEISQQNTVKLQNLFINCGVETSANLNKNANLLAYYNDHSYDQTTNGNVLILNMMNNVSLADIIRIEKKTRRQYKCDLWKRYRQSRITASMAGNICKTVERNNFAKCYAESIVSAKTFSTPATRWGTSNEPKALKSYMERTKISVCSCGLFIDPLLNYIAGTPDARAIDNSTIIEVKCPYQKSLKDVQYLSGNPQRLKQNHNYYYQVQLQMHVTKIYKCDFVVWTPEEIHIETIDYDNNFVNGCLDKIEKYYEQVFCDVYVSKNPI